MKDCQSCGMPLDKDDNGPVDNYGTMIDGSRSEEYCKYCFQNGKFTDPDLTGEEMFDKVSGFFVDMNMPVEVAKEMARTKLSKLNRWNKAKN